MVVVLIILQVVIALYHFSILWIDFFPFNKIQNYSITERVIETLLHAFLYVFSFLSVWLVWSDVQSGIILFYLALVGTGLMVWWIPFVVGPSNKWKFHYNRMFLDQTKVFKTNKPTVPTLEVAIMHALQLCFFILLVLHKWNLIQGALIK